MNNKINIADILKDCPKTRYSPWVTEKTFVEQYQKIREKF